MAISTATRPTSVTSLGHTTVRQDLITTVLATWLVVGLFVDGWAHTNLIDEFESFFTPYHAIFYSGFLATASWVILLGAQRVMQEELAFFRSMPVGYEGALAGIIIFGLAGVGDGIWHTIRGVETGIDALLSPTHLMLLSGGLLGMLAPVRAAWHRNPDASDPTWREFAPAAIAMTLVLGTIAFFLAYLWGPALPEFVRQPFDQNGAFYGLGSMYVSTAAMVGPVVCALRRWRPPFGFVTAMWVSVNVLVATAFSLNVASAVTGAMVGGLVTDLAIYWFRGGPQRPNTVRVVCFAGPVALWLTFFWVAARDGGLSWPIELWAGSTFLCGLIGGGMALLAFLAPPNLTRPHSG